MAIRRISSLVPSDMESSRGLKIPILSIEKTKYPIVWISACSHGDEVGGVAIIHELFKILNEKLVKGSVYSFPMANPIAFDDGTRLVNGKDLNRAFPGKDQGSVADKTAKQIFNAITKTKPSLVIDLHNDWTHSIPYTVIDPIPGTKSEKALSFTRQMAKKTGFIAVEETVDELDDSTVSEWKKTLTGSLVNSGIPAMVLEVGESKVINENNVKMGVASILNVLSEMGMVEGINRFVHPSSSKIGDKILFYSGRPRSSTKGGIIRFGVKPGDLVKKGQALATIYDILGKEIEVVKSEEDGVILGHAETSVAKPELGLIAIAVF